MADKQWLGGAAAVTQVDHLTPGGTIESNDKFIVTMRDENGGTSSISAAAGGTTVSAVCTAVHAALSTSVDPLFAAVEWTEDGSKIVGTAKVSGVPFYCSVSTTESDDGPADDQTFVRTSSTANAGPNDWRTAANWSGGTIPSGGDNIFVLAGAHSILYGLETGLSFVNVFRGTGFTGSVGDPIKGFSLMFQAQIIQIEQSAGNTLLKANVTGGSFPHIRIWEVAPGTSVTLATSPNTVIMSGSRVGGAVRVKSGSVLANLIVSDCPSAQVIVESGVTSFASSNLGSGFVDISSACTTVNVNGATVNWRAGNIATLNMHSGTFSSIGSGSITTALNSFGGTFMTVRSEAPSLTIANGFIYGGLLNLTGTTVTWSAGPLNFGNATILT